MATSKPEDDERKEQQMDTSSATPTSTTAGGFTAVNGKASPPSQAKAKPDQEIKKSPQETSSHRQLLPNNHESAPPPPPPPQRDNGRPMAPMHERRLSPAPSNNNPHNNPDPRPVTNGHSQHTQHSDGYGSSHQQQPPPPPPPQQQQPPPPHAVMSPPVPRRRRSLSQERPPIYPGNGPPPSPGHRMSIDGGDVRQRDPYGPRHPYSPPHENYGPPHDPYPPPPNHHSYPPPPQEHSGQGPHDIYSRPERHSGGSRMDYEHSVDPSITPGGSRPYYQDPHDAQLADALQRENRGYGDGPPNRDTFNSPEDDDDQNGPYDDYGGRDSQSVDADRRKRKRIFSNRTKTGCMTCRRRKKKCDELHPECQNCLRGGFVCEGYNARHNWQKPPSAKPPITIQSKNGYPPAPSGMSNRPPSYPPAPRYDTAPEYPGPPPSHHRGSYDGGRPGPPPPQPPPQPEEERDPYARPDAQGKSQSAWNKAARPYPSNPPQASKYEGRSQYEHRGSIYEDAPDGPPPPHSSHPPPPSSSRRESTVSQYAPPPHSTHNGTPAPPRDAQAAAQAALTHPASHRSGSQREHDMSERERMLRGLYYHPTNPILVQDRENCIAAIWRFNNATNPSHGVSPEERIRLFRQILTLRPTLDPTNRDPSPPSEYTLPTGSVGENCIVEAPFACDYGYNIKVGDNVLIGSDCRISDTCQVSIGSRTIFSPNVKLICSTYPIDPRRREGAQGPALSRNIVIEDDCWIGPNVTILAGVRIGRSSTVGAGSLVHQDVNRFTVVAGNPAVPSRGVYDATT